ncbi:MAG: hypothetical protein CSA52_01810, partial [Gammaproteobacteria bacterium]
MRQNRATASTQKLTHDSFTGISSFRDLGEDQEILQVFQWISFAGVLILLAIGTKSIYSGHPQHGVTLYLFGSILLANS